MFPDPITALCGIPKPFRDFLEKSMFSNFLMPNPDMRRGWLSWCGAHRPRKLDAYGLWDRFAFGGFSDDDEDRNLIAAAAKVRGGEYLECRLDGPEIVVVGATPRDVACGRHIGARTLAVATGGATLEALQECEPDWAVPDLTHLSAAEVCGR